MFPSTRLPSGILTFLFLSYWIIGIYGFWFWDAYAHSMKTRIMDIDGIGCRWT
jgi:hypothetical protein